VAAAEFRFDGPAPDRGRGARCSATARRTGNVRRPSNLAMNLFQPGRRPRNSNISDIDAFAPELPNTPNRLPISPTPPVRRRPSFTPRFSGSHQDAIKKGFEAPGARTTRYGACPYLPIDPKHVGPFRTRAVIRVNSQFGPRAASLYIMKGRAWLRPAQAATDRVLPRHPDDHRGLRHRGSARPICGARFSEEVPARVGRRSPLVGPRG